MLEKNPPDLCLGQSFPRLDAAADPIAMARRDLNKALPRRFYKEAVADERKGSFVLLLDGRTANPRAATVWRCQRWRRRGRWQTNGRRWAKLSIRH